MRIERVVINASPLIALFCAGLHPLLPQLFPELPVPEAVDLYDFNRAGLADDNRWDSKGEPTLYLARDKDVALVEWARHWREDRDPRLARYAKRRKVCRFQVRLEHTLDLCDAGIWRLLSLKNALHGFLDRAAARATAGFVRRTTQTEAVFVPSVAFLDRLDKWVLVVFLEKLPDDPRRFLRAAIADGEFAVFHYP